MIKGSWLIQFTARSMNWAFEVAIWQSEVSFLY